MTRRRCHPKRERDKERGRERKIRQEDRLKYWAWERLVEGAAKLFITYHLPLFYCLWFALPVINILLTDGKNPASHSPLYRSFTLSSPNTSPSLSLSVSAVLHFASPDFLFGDSLHHPVLRLSRRGEFISYLLLSLLSHFNCVTYLKP